MYSGILAVLPVVYDHRRAFKRSATKHKRTTGRRELQATSDTVLQADGFVIEFTVGRVTNCLWFTPCHRLPVLLAVAGQCF